MLILAESNIGRNIVRSEVESILRVCTAEERYYCFDHGEACLVVPPAEDDRDNVRCGRVWQIEAVKPCARLSIVNSNVDERSQIGFH